MTSNKEILTASDAFYAAIGRAIAEWASVEQSLFRIFLSALDGADHHAASAAFHSVLAFSAKLDMTSATLQVRLGRKPLHAGYSHFIEPHPILDQWLGVKNDMRRRQKSLHGKISTLSKERNKLAHYVVVVDRSLKDHPVPKLRKTPYNAANLPSHLSEENAYETERITEMQASFATLFTEMEDYVSLINDTLGQLPISVLRQNCVLDPRPQVDRHPKEP
jgi:hypothetical protein